MRFSWRSPRLLLSTLLPRQFKPAYDAWSRIRPDLADVLTVLRLHFEKGQKANDRPKRMAIARTLLRQLPVPTDLPAPLFQPVTALYLALRPDGIGPLLAGAIRPGPSQVPISTLGRVLDQVEDLSAALRGVDVERTDRRRRALILRKLATNAYDTWRLDDAVVHARAALRLDPRDIGALNVLADALSFLGDIEEAIRHTKAVLDVAPLHRAAINRLGYLGDPSYAEVSAPERLMRLAKADRAKVKTAVDAGWICLDRRDLEAAETLADMALAAWKPLLRDGRQLEQIHGLRAQIRHLRGDPVGALMESAVAVVRLRKAGSSIQRAATAMVDLGDFEGAAEVMSLTDPAAVPVNSQGYQASLSNGRLREAFLFYRGRPQSRQLQAAYPGKTRADLDLDDPRLATMDAFVYPEGGPGDEIRLASVYRDVAARVRSLTLACDPRLQTLLERSFPSFRFVPVPRFRGQFRTTDYRQRDRVPSILLAQALTNRALAEIERAGFACSILDTLADLRSDRAAFPRRAGYLTVDPDRRQQFQASIAGSMTGPARRQVALCWRSLLTSGIRDVHYLTPADLAPLADLADTDFWVAQVDCGAEELDELRAVLPSVKVMEGLDLKDDLDGTAAFLSCMDHVVSAFITNGELAGALGVPTSLLSTTHVTAWRRGSDGSDVWHASARVLTGEPIFDRASLVRVAAADIRSLWEARPASRVVNPGLRSAPAVRIQASG